MRISLVGVLLAIVIAAAADSRHDSIVLAAQGSFFVGGTIVTAPGVFDP